jgi:parallel beta-helix repeat protein
MAMTGQWTRRLATALVVMIGLGGAAAVTPAAADTVPVVGCDRADTRISLSASATLDPSCTYTQGIDIVASNVVLDCDNALIQRSGGGIGILVTTPADVDMVDVTIRHCRVDGFLNSIHLRRDGFNHLAAGEEYVHHLDGVHVEDNLLTNSSGVSVYVDGYVTGTTIAHNGIFNAGSDAVYLDAGSRYGTVVENALVHNGYQENGDEGQLTDFNGVQFRSWGPGREGIAIDGSRDNLVARNWIVDSSAGGVFLYTNCGEYVHQQPASWVEHRYGAEGNHVEDNIISGGENGVWVGSRMAENVFPMDCSDVPYVSGPIQAITLDRAANNTIRRNTIMNVTYGVRVEDDGTRVVRNTFLGADGSKWAVIVGTPFRATVLHHPVTNTLVRGNRSLIVGNTSPYRWVTEVDGLVAYRNRASGAEAGFCEAPEPPRGPFVMTYAIAVQPAGAPPVPKPDFEIPRLGALPACS